MSPSTHTSEAGPSETARRERCAPACPQAGRELTLRNTPTPPNGQAAGYSGFRAEEPSKSPPASAPDMPSASAPDRPCASAPVLPSASPPRWAWLWLNRSRRVLFTLAAVWVINVFDLGFTLAQWGVGEFRELNPVAEKLLNGPEHVLVAYKFSLLSAGTLILLLLRRHFIAELGCWFLLAAKLYVAVRWFAYFDCLVHGRQNPLVEV